MSELGSESGSISSHDGRSKTTQKLILIRNPRSYKQFRHPSTDIHYSRDSNCKVFLYYKVAGDNFSIKISAMSANATILMNIVSLNEHMALNLNEYMFLKLIYFFEWI